MRGGGKLASTLVARRPRETVATKALENEKVRVPKCVALSSHPLAARGFRYPRRQRRFSSVFTEAPTALSWAKSTVGQRDVGAALYRHSSITSLTNSIISSINYSISLIMISTIVLIRRPPLSVERVRLPGTSPTSSILQL